MAKVTLEFSFAGTPSLLCVGAHCDDIEIGCSGTVLRLLEQYPNIEVTWLILTADGVRRKEAEASAMELAGDGMPFEILFHDFRDGFLPYTGHAVKDAFEALKTRIEPDLVLCHWEGDRHQDHRFVSELAASTFRSSLILEYEIPKYDGDTGRPNIYVPISESIMARKIGNLMKNHSSQVGRYWFDEETFRSLHRLRGIETGPKDRYAEAFHCRKLTVLG